MKGHIKLNFNILGLFIGPGLLRLHRGWRTCALTFLWGALIGVPIVSMIFLGHHGPFDLKLFGQKVVHASKHFALLLAVAVFLTAVWQYSVLTRPDIRAMFGLTEEPGESENEPE